MTKKDILNKIKIRLKREIKEHSVPRLGLYDDSSHMEVYNEGVITGRLDFANELIDMISRYELTEKNKHTTRTKFDLWLEKCPLPKWNFRETEYRDYTQVNLRFRIPRDGEPVEHGYIVDYRGLNDDA